MMVGITGHQELTFADAEWLKQGIENEIMTMKIEGAYSCLAIGADQLFASVIISHKIPLIAIIPCREYEETFNDKNIRIYKNLLNQASKKIHLDFDYPSEEAFYEAGNIVVNKSDVVFAFWNNLPSKGLGGTADIVSIAQKLNKPIIHFNPITKTKNFINYA